MFVWARCIVAVCLVLSICVLKCCTTAYVSCLPAHDWLWSELSGIFIRYKFRRGCTTLKS